MKKVISYDLLTEEQKTVAQEIVDILNSLGHEVIGEVIKHKFKLEDPKRYNFAESQFIKKCEENNIHLSLQGYVFENGVNYQIFSITDDIRKFEKVFK